MPKQTWLITGGAGFIGSAVVRHLIANTDVSVVNVDKLTYAGNLESLEALSTNPRYSFEHADICNGDALAKVFQQYQPTAVMHLAAESHVDRSIDGPAEFMQTNIMGTYQLLEVAKAYWQNLPEENKKQFRFHHVSTDEVYGDLPHPADVEGGEALGVTGEGEKLHTSRLTPSPLPLFTEQTAYAPSSPYSASKAASDHLVRAWHRTYGLPVVLSNCSNNYGPYQFPEKLIPLVILNALEGKPLPIYGKGDQIRDWLYVDDHAKALVKVLLEGKLGETYNIGGHNEKTNLDVVYAICSALEELAPIQHSKSNIQNYKSLITFVQDRPGHDRRYAIDASKIALDLGWKPEETFETGIRKTVEWYLQNSKWCQRVQDGSYQRQRLGVDNVEF